MVRAFRISPAILAGLLLLWAVAASWAESCRVLILSPANTFSAADIADQLESLLQGSGDFTDVEVTYRDIARDLNYATSLLSVAYVPPYRAEHITAIREGGWTHVVMIDRPFLYSAAPELHYTAVNAVAKIISAAGAEPVLLMPWVDRVTMDGSPVNNAVVREIAYRVGDGARDSLGRSVPVVPAGVAWSTLDPGSRGTLLTQPSTGVSLNANGKYSAAASLFTYLTGGNAKSVAFLPAGLTTGVRDAIADHAAAVAVSEAASVRYSGEFQSARVRFWDELPSLAFSAEGTSTENAIGDQLVKIAADDGKSSVDTRGIFAKNATGSQVAASLVFGRSNNLSNVAGYDVGNPVTTMVAGFDRQGDTVSNGPAAAIHAEFWTIYLYKLGALNGWNYVPYHLLWVQTMYDLNIPIDPFSVHAPDWQFAAVASALYTQRMNGRNGIYPATAGYVYWSPALRTQRFAWQTGQMAWRMMHEMATLRPAPAAPARAFGLDRVIDAEYAAASSRSIARSPHAVETFQLDGLSEGDWTSYLVDFGEPSPLVVSAIAHVASAVPGAAIEVRDGSAAGTLLGTISVIPGAGPDDFQESRGLLSTAGLAGVRELFFVYRVPAGEHVKLDYFRLSVQARPNESVWTSSSPGAWESGANWLETAPGGMGWLARFSLDIPGGLPPNTAVTLNQSHVLTTLELGHGVGTTGGVRLRDGGSGALAFQSDSGPAVIRKLAGGDDVIEIPVESQAPLQIRNETNSLLSIGGPITGQQDLLPSGKVNFSGAGYDLGRLGFSTGMTYPANVETAFLGGTFNWTATGTVRDFYLPQHTIWTINDGELTNLGFTEIGNDDTATSGGSSTLTINGGIFRHGSEQLLRLGQYYKASSFINLNGGVFETHTEFTKSAGAATVTFNGGILRYAGASDVADLFSAGANPDVIAKVGVGGAHLEVTESRSVSLQNDLTPVGSTDGGLRKSGRGTLVLTGANTFKGPIVVDEGELIVGGEGAIGYGNHFTVRSGATLSLPGPLSIGVYGVGSGWVGGGTIIGGILVSSAPMDLTDGTLVVSGDVTLINPTISVAPRAGEVIIDAGGGIELYGSLTVHMRAPAVAVPAGAQVTLVSGGVRDGEFSSVLGSGLWGISHTENAAVLTAQVNIPGVTVPPINSGEPAVWGDVITLTAATSDVVGVAGVEFYANGRLIGEGERGPGGEFALEWDLSKEAAQTFSITARVTNLDGVTVESIEQNLTVDRLSGSSAIWTNLAGGAWSTGGNWLGGEVADDYDDAFFDTLDLPVGNATVEVDSPRTLAALHFRDLDLTTVGTWRVAGVLPNLLTLSGGAAEISVAAGSDVEIAAPLAAPGGFTKSGEGTLTLSAPNAGLSESTSVTAGTLSVTHPSALGESTLTLSGGGFSLPSAVTLANPLELDANVLTTLTVSAPVTWSGDWTNSDAVAGTTLRLWSTTSLATVNLANTIFMPDTDLEVAGLTNTVNFSGNVTVRNFKFYGRTGSPQGNLEVIFSGDAVVSCLQAMATVNDGRTTNIRINDDAQLTIPGCTTSARSNIYLNGGILTAAQIPMGTVSGFYANGGVLRAMASNPQFMVGMSGTTRPILVQPGGLTLDTAGFNVGVNASIITNSTQDGGVTKTGLGTMTVTGESVNMTWRGPTRVQAGTLGFGSLSGLSVNSKVFHIASGATLDIATSTTPTLVLTSTSHSLNAGGTLVGALSVTSGTLTVAVGQSFVITGSAALGGNLVVTGNVTAPGDYVLLTAESLSGEFAPSPVLPTLPIGFSCDLLYEANRVLLRVTGPGDAWLQSNAPGGARFTDLDANGMSYLQKYALGSGEGHEIRIGRSPVGRSQIGFSYKTAATDAAIQVQSSPDLVNWTTLLSKPSGPTMAWTVEVPGSEIQTEAPTSGWQSVIVTAPATTDSPAFLRVRVQRGRP